MNKQQIINLKSDVDKSGLQKAFIASKVGIGSTHLSMMLSGKANMPEDIRVKITSLIKQAAQISA